MTNILVTGDIAIDCHLVRQPSVVREHLHWNDQSRAHYGERWGGAALLARLMERAAAGMKDIQVTSPVLPTPVPAPDSDFLRNFAAWKQQEKEARNDSKDKAWRVAEYLGIQPGGQLPARAGASATPDILVLDDANLDQDLSPQGFCRNPGLWPECLTSAAGPSWVVWKLWRREFSQDIGELLLKKSPARLVLVLAAKGLREAGDFISKGVSWERTAQELYRAVKGKFGSMLDRKPALQIIISLGAAGVFIYSGGAEAREPHARLVYDPKFMEDEWEALRPGKIIGQTACLTAGISLAIARSPEQPDWIAGATAGLAAMRNLHTSGFECPSPDCAGLDFPYATVGTTLASVLAALVPAKQVGQKSEIKTEFVSTVVPDPKGELLASVAGREMPGHASCGRWTILQSKFGVAIHEQARLIARKGVGKSLATVPVLSIGGLTTADRQEIESFRNISNLFAEYTRGLPAQKEAKPVSVAVFGPPGSGKSFGVKQIAKSLPGKVDEITFNLSQMRDPAELAAAFHRIRDSRLRGNLPLVFWDEFDTSLQGSDLGWLRYFLSPMQDGTFSDGQIEHPIGPALFVFAGGTRSCFQEFNCRPGQEGFSGFKAAKGPDFVSRLRGYLDILGPNPRGGDPVSDPTYVIRRAILLNSMLARLRPDLKQANKEISINEGVLRAFLTVSEYKHGARSMESIVTSSALSGESRFEPFCLPQQDQLDLYVPAWEFMALVEYPSAITPEREVELARAFHENFRVSLQARGYKYGAESNDELKISSQLVEWEALPRNFQADNLSAVRAIPDKLAAVGYVMAPGTPGKQTELLPEVFERLAELEHERWLHVKIADGWRQALPQRGKPRYLRENAKQIHDAMLPWNEMTVEERAVHFPEDPEAVGLEALPDSQKEKDRDQVRGMMGAIGKLQYVLLPSAVKARHLAGAKEIEDPARQKT